MCKLSLSFNDRQQSIRPDFLWPQYFEGGYIPPAVSDHISETKLGTKTYVISNKRAYFSLLNDIGEILIQICERKI